MAQVKNFEAALRNETDNPNKLEFFSLKNDGDEAIVRFMHDDVNSFDIVTTHKIYSEGKYAGRVNCLREAHEPIDHCPLCAKGDKPEHRFYIHMLQYTRDEMGNMVSTPKVWERSLSYAKELKNLISDYGPLSNCLFKVRRNGAAGDMKTTYSLTICMPQNYPPELYPLTTDDLTLFGEYTAIGNAVMNRTFDELFTYATTGVMPQAAAETPAQTVPAASVTAMPPVQTVVGVQPAAGQSPIRFMDGATTTAVPNEPFQGVQQVQINRPIRTY